MAIKILQEDYFEATFIERLNRFVVRCKIGSKIISAYLPNPGRLIELLIRGSTLYIVRAHKGYLKYKAIAVLKEDSPVLLDTHMNNLVAKTLIEKGFVQGFNNFDSLRGEVKAGESRFDFMLSRGDKHHYLEIKSCTFFGSDIAMFPDAPTERGIRHLKELADLSVKGFKSHVVFIVHSHRPSLFMPDYHTDIAFSRTFIDVYNTVNIKALGVKWSRQLEIDEHIKELHIPIRFIQQESQDRGGYMIILRIDKDRKINIGSLGAISFNRGYYIYAGSAMKNLTSRMARHKRRIKKKFWHIDYLMNEAEYITAFAIRASERIECSIAAKISNICGWSISSFGSSDCGCESHLFGFHNNPLHEKEFIEALLWLRINRLKLH